MDLKRFEYMTCIQGLHAFIWSMQTGDDEYTESICRPRYHTYKRSVRSETYTWRRIRDVWKTAHVSSADEYRLVWVQYTRLHTVHCRAVEGDPWIELYRLRYHKYICQIIARYEVHNQLQFLAYVSTFPLFYTKHHFEADRHSDRDKPYKDNIGQHQSRDKRHNSFMYSRSWQRPPRHYSYWKSSRSQIVWSPTADASVE